MSRGGRPARERFTTALTAEIRSFRIGAGVRFDTLYLGGGTPSLLEPEQLEAILAAARAALPLDPEAFVVLEANPEDVAPAALDAWRGLGVRGLSLGVQSFHDGVLRFLGRRHGAARARRAVELSLGAGFDWVSLDLIYGSPADGPVRGRGHGGHATSSRAAEAGPPGASWDPEEVALADVDAAASLGPHHLSCYQLTVHQGTAFERARDRGR
ncbi:MAG TPA: radical SAM protein, partial [Thermoanaerobaculia bacterium]|nr:radical SAM protein [Thermoanaerobaculia bacterium]